jgi:cold shock CspA family protein
MTSTTTDTQLGRRIGQVKWFNNKAGYGFITVSGDDSTISDIFIHFSSIRVTNSQYKYLIQGEYVEFNLVKSDTETHEFQANDVSGINGGSLMCETRRNAQSNDNTDVQGLSSPTKPVLRREHTMRGGPVKRSTDESGEFTTIRRRKPQSKSNIQRSNTLPAPTQSTSL